MNKANFIFDTKKFAFTFDIIFITMKIIEKNSVLSETIDFTLSETDQQVLALLYMPIIKAESFALYQALLHLKGTMNLQEYITHETLLFDLGFTDTTFLKAREKLEGIGLLETYRSEQNDDKGNIKVFYCYHLLPPASPKKFFSDILLRVTLEQAVGSKRYFFLMNLFRMNKNGVSDQYQNISASFKDVYTLNITPDNPAMTDGGNVFVDKNYKNQSNFDKQLFIDNLTADNISVNQLKDDIDEAAEVSILYSLDSQTAYRFFVSSLDTQNKFYSEHFKKQARNYNRYQKAEEKVHDKATLGEGESSQKIRYLETTPPKEFLQDYYHAEPAAFMLKTIEHLYFDLQLNNSVITAILSYSLNKTDGAFHSNFIEKVGYSLAGKHITDAYEAMVYFENREFELKKLDGYTSAKKKRSKKTEEVPPAKENETVSEDDVMSLAEDLGL